MNLKIIGILFLYFLPLLFSCALVIYLFQKQKAAHTRLEQHLQERSSDLEAANLTLQAEINERLRTGEILRESESKFRTLFEASLDPNLLLKGDVLIQCNPAALRYLKVDYPDVIGQKPYIMSPPFQPDGSPSAVKALQLIEEANSKGHIKFEWVHRRKDGTDFWVEVSLTRIVLDGEPHLYTTWRDITDHKLAVESLRLSEEKFRSSIEWMSEGFVLIDEDGYIIEWNHAVEKLTGIAKSEAMGKTKQILQSGELHVQEGSVETQMIDRNGVKRIISQLVFTIQTERGHRIGLILRDITAKKQNENRMLQLNQALKMLSNCNLSLIRAQDERSLFHEICQTIVEVGGYRFAWIGLLMGEQQPSIIPVVSKVAQDLALEDLKFPCLTYPMVCPPIMKCVDLQEPVLVQEMFSHPLCQTCAEESKRNTFSSLVAFPLTHENERYGCLMIVSADLESFSEEKLGVLNEMASDISFGIHTLRVREERTLALKLLKESKQDLEDAYDATLEGWSRALELRERETAGHSFRVMTLTMMLAKEMGIPEDQMVHIRRGALLHDIGKMGIPDSILLKSDQLTAEEWDLMHQHPLYAKHLLENITYLAPAMEIPLFHHEHWRGTGYPFGLVGEQIPLAARIFSVVDVWDALTSERPYHRAWTSEETLTYLVQNSNILFDPLVVNKFIGVLNKLYVFDEQSVE